ncbi:large ribosomal subunit protein mL40 [Onthophagus taurus]|uniref:large ribosomal subunit protein mL40 n=1 Tax=Onthophagus taurus TaxID=166361 RepID=UPI000C20103C|nr:39S ribosomal protein L40, mitochondrial [Onthophagus taurus]
MSIISALSRLSLKQPSRIPVLISRYKIENKLFLHTTPALCAEPLKKKKRLDPAVIKARDDRKKKRIEKQIRKLEKNARQLKPIEELEIPMVIIDHKKERYRKSPALTAETLEERILLEKQWSQFKKQEYVKDLKMLDRIAYSQQKALDELRKESEELYQEAIQPDLQLIPYGFIGPVETPPIEGYNAPDGDYQDVSKKWE